MSGGNQASLKMGESRGLIFEVADKAGMPDKEAERAGRLAPTPARALRQ